MAVLAMRRIGLVTIVVRDYDEAVSFYVDVLGFNLVEDAALSDGKRWVVVSPDRSGDGTGFLLARAMNPEQESRVGNQTGGRVAFFLYTDEFDDELARLNSAGVTIDGPTRDEPYGRVAVLQDLYGNRWTLIQPA
jgi:catechol 2,3-dioxygenase-like lactoylglutathione lyase family enzyme